MAVVNILTTPIGTRNIFIISVLDCDLYLSYFPKYYISNCLKCPVFKR